MERIYFRKQLCISELSVSTDKKAHFCSSAPYFMLYHYGSSELLSSLSYLPGKAPTQKKKLIDFCFLLHRF